MDTASILLILAAAGVNFGWQPVEGTADGLEYIVQVEPELLDALRSGEAVPIESNVPPDVGPIRKVSIVVGRGDLPRTTADAVNRTANFAGEAGWAPDRFTASPPAATSNYDRYGPPPRASQSAVGPPPSVLDRAQSAVKETGTTLRDGVEAGIQAANQQLSRGGGQVLDATRNAGEDVGRQLQDWTNDPAGQLQSTSSNLRTAAERAVGSVGNQLQQVTNPFAKTNAPAPTSTRAQGAVSQPPWPAPSRDGALAAPAGPVVAQPADPTASPGMVPTQTESGWTSIGSSVAAPPLLIPQLGSTMSSNAVAASQTAGGTPGPIFPDRSLPAAAPSDEADDWATSWGSESVASQATIGRGGSTGLTGNGGREADLVPVQPVIRGPQNSQQAANNGGDPWAETDPWALPPQSTPSVTVPQAGNQANATAAHNDANDWQLGGNRPAMPVANSQANEIPTGGVNNNTGPRATGDGGRQPASAGPAAASQPPQFATTEQPPWLPLLIVSLSLMGSLSANLFLGWSYMDARQKYRSLVRKTADTFRRATSAGA